MEARTPTVTRVPRNGAAPSFGAMKSHASIWRVLGGVLMVAGVALVALF
jgi:hypothetical protein